MKPFGTFFLYMLVSFIATVAAVVLGAGCLYFLPDKCLLPDQTISDRFISQNGQTFDLLGVAYKSIHCSFVKIFTGSRWSHVAVLYRVPRTTTEREKKENPNLDEGRLYVLEAIHTRKVDVEIQAVPFDVWMKRNQDFEIVYVNCKQKISPPQVSLLMSEFFKFSNQSAKVNMNLIRWACTLKRIAYVDSPVSYDRVFCTEFVAHLLQTSQLLPKEDLPCCYTPLRLLYECNDVFGIPRRIIKTIITKKKEQRKWRLVKRSE